MTIPGVDMAVAISIVRRRGVTGYESAERVLNRCELRRSSLRERPTRIRVDDRYSSATEEPASDNPGNAEGTATSLAVQRVALAILSRNLPFQHAGASRQPVDEQSHDLVGATVVGELLVEREFDGPSSWQLD